MHTAMLALKGDSGVARPLRDGTDVLEVARRTTAERGHQLALAQPDLPGPRRIGNGDDESAVAQADGAGRIGGRTEDLARRGRPGVDRRDARNVAVETAEQTYTMR